MFLKIHRYTNFSLNYFKIGKTFLLDSTFKSKVKFSDYKSFIFKTFGRHFNLTITSKKYFLSRDLKN